MASPNTVRPVAELPGIGRGLSPRNRCTHVLALSVLVAGLAACGGSSGGSKGSVSSSPYEVSFTDTITGPIGPGFLAPEASGFKAYVQALNKRGGVNGRQIKVTTMDDRGDPAVAVTNIQQIASSSSIAALGSPFSTMAVAQAPFAEQKQLPFIVGAVPDSLISPAKKYLFSTNLPHGAAGVIQVDFAKELLSKAGISKPRVATINNNSPGSHDFAKIVKQRVEGYGWSLITQEEHVPGTTDFSAETAAIARAKPDVIISEAVTGEITAIVKDLRQRGVKAPVVTSYVAADDSAFSQLNDSDFYAPRSWVYPKDDPTVAADAAAAGVSGDTVTTYFTHGYGMGIVLEKALVKCGKSCDRAGLRDALEGLGSVDTKGLSGPTSLGPDDHVLLSSAKIYKWDPASKHAVPVTDQYLELTLNDWLLK
jgi:branched-chain amino acid transport system substrate-binding protein